MLFTEEQKLEVISDIFKQLDKKFPIGIQNRNDSYQKCLSEGLNKQEEIIVDAIRNGYTNARTIAEYTGIEIVPVRARLSELVDKDILKEVGKIYWKETNRTITVYGFKDKLFD